MKNYFELKSLSTILDSYDIFFIDLWGVIHNGISIFENVLPVLENLKKANKIVFFITNAPRRAFVIAEQLEQFGIKSNLYQKVVSSGELTWHRIKEKYQKKNCFIIGPPRDHHLIEGFHFKLSHP